MAQGRARAFERMDKGGGNQSSKAACSSQASAGDSCSARRQHLVAHLTPFHCKRLNCIGIPGLAVQLSRRQLCKQHRWSSVRFCMAHPLCLVTAPANRNKGRSPRRELRRCACTTTTIQTLHRKCTYCSGAPAGGSGGPARLRSISAINKASSLTNSSASSPSSSCRSTSSQLIDLRHFPPTLADEACD